MKTFKFKDYNIYVADIETIAINQPAVIGLQAPIAIGFYNGASIKTYSLQHKNDNLVEQFINDLAREAGSKNYVFFHNLAKFDGYILMSELKNKKKYNTELILRDNSIYQITFTINNKIIIIKDSYLLIPFSLKKAGELFECNLKKIEYAFNDKDLDFYLNNSKAMSLLIEYMKNDLFLLWEILIKTDAIFLGKFNINIYNNLTLYSLSQKIFLRKFYKGSFITLKDNEENFIKKSYFGGMNEVIKPYGQNLIMLDVNSMYPFIMRNIELGKDSGRFIFENKELKDLKTFTKKNIGFTKVIVDCKKNYRYPLIPYQQEDHKIIYPTGIFIATVWNRTLNYCLEHLSEYYSFTPLNSVIFEETEMIFEKYIDLLYAERLKKHGVLYKKMMNSLYGRFGLDVSKNAKTALISSETELLPFLSASIDIDNQHFIDDANMLITYKNKEDASDSQRSRFKTRVDWASAITSEARVYLHKIISQVPTLYYDTDAIVIENNNINKIENFLDDTGLGKMKIVEKNIQEGVFLAQKIYALKLKENNKYKYVFKTRGFSKPDYLTDEAFFSIFKRKLEEQDLSITSKKELFITQKSTFSIKIYNVERNFKIEYAKREKIIKNNRWVDTSALLINEYKIIKKDE